MEPETFIIADLKRGGWVTGRGAFTSTQLDKADRYTYEEACAACKLAGDPQLGVSRVPVPFFMLKEILG